MRLDCYAKVNIGLSVGEVRSDGYHGIRTNMALISLSDTIEVDFRESDRTSVAISGNTGYLEAGRTDLMEKVLIAYSERTGFCVDASIWIEKRIPAGSGLGGGSSDAASVLKAVNGFFGNRLTPDELASLSASVGSDIPFFVYGYPLAFASGRGEIIEPLDPMLSGRELVVICDSMKQDTGDAYARLDRIARSSACNPMSGSVLTRRLYPNDFELVAESRALGIAREACADGKSYYSLSGSGSSAFIIAEEAEKTFDKIYQSNSNCDNFLVKFI